MAGTFTPYPRGRASDEQPWLSGAACRSGPHRHWTGASASKRPRCWRRRATATGSSRRIADALIPAIRPPRHGPSPRQSRFVTSYCRGAQQCRLTVIRNDNFYAFNAAVQAVTRTIPLCAGTDARLPVRVTARSQSRSGGVAVQHLPAVARTLGPPDGRRAARSEYD
jgi:hypothetical protein